MKKNILLTFVLMCISIFAFGMMNVSASYSGTKYGDYLYYTASNGEITITDCSDRATEVEIPATIGGKPVTAIGKYAFCYCSSLTSVTIPDSVTSIDQYAFGGCSGLTSITIPDSVTTIGKDAFVSCSGLTSITIPDSVTTIVGSAFYECSSLTSVTIGNSVTTIGGSAFYGCDSLKKVNITDIEAWCNIEFCVYYGGSYYDYSSNPLCYAKNLYLNGDWVTDLVIPDSVTEIDSYAFYNCHSLTSITVPDSVTTISGLAFVYCSSLKKVNITDMEAWCNIKFCLDKRDNYYYYISNPLYYAGNLYLNGDLVTDLVIPDSVTTIGSYAFYNCNSLTSVTIPDSVTTIGERAFDDCSSLTSVTIPDSVTTIGNSAFYGCSSLTSMTIGDSVTTIGKRTFEYCSRLTSVTIPKSVVVINEYAFRYCENISAVYYNGTEDDWDEIYIYKGNDALTNATLKTICYIKLVDSDGKESTVTYLLNEKISLSDLEKTYKRKLTLYTDSAMTNEFDTSAAITDNMTLYVKLGEETAIYGDLNGDGNVNVKDNMMLARYLAEWPDYDETTVDLAAADLNGDGKVNVKDNMILARHLAEWPGYETLPVTN